MYYSKMQFGIRSLFPVLRNFRVSSCQRSRFGLSVTTTSRLGSYCPFGNARTRASIPANVGSPKLGSLSHQPEMRTPSTTIATRFYSGTTSRQPSLNSDKECLDALRTTIISVERANEHLDEDEADENCLNGERRADIFHYAYNLCTFYPEVGNALGAPLQFDSNISDLWIDGSSKSTVRMEFEIKGTLHKGKVHLEMMMRPDGKSKTMFATLRVDVHSDPTRNITIPINYIDAIKIVPRYEIVGDGGVNTTSPGSGITLSLEKLQADNIFKAIEEDVISLGLENEEVQEALGEPIEIRTSEDIMNPSSELKWCFEMEGPLAKGMMTFEWKKRNGKLSSNLRVDVRGDHPRSIPISLLLSNDGKMDPFVSLQIAVLTKGLEEWIEKYCNNH